MTHVFAIFCVLIFFVLIPSAGESRAVVVPLAVQAVRKGTLQETDVQETTLQETGSTESAPPRAAQKLQWELSVGERFGVEFDHRVTTFTTVDKRNVQTQSSTAITMDWEVVQVDEDRLATIEQTIAAIRLSVGNPAFPQQAVAFDTEVKAKLSRTSAKILKQVRPLVGLKFRVVMTPRGETVSVDVPEETLAVLRDLPETLPLQSVFSDAGIKDLLKAASVVLPETPIVQGQSWCVSDDVAHPLGGFVRTREYRFSGVENQGDSEIAKITLDTTFVSRDEGAVKPAGKIISLTESGKLEMNLGGGYFTASEIHSVVKSEKPYRESKIETAVEVIQRMFVTRL